MRQLTRELGKGFGGRFGQACAALFAVAAVWWIGSAAARAQEKAGVARAFEIADVNRIATVAEPVFTPDGRSIFYSVATANLSADESTSDLWRVRVEDGRARNLTRTKTASEWKPLVSPDGRRLFFISDRTKDETPQIFAASSSGGAARQISELENGVEDYALSPDGLRIVVVTETGGPAENGAGTEPPVVIDAYVFKVDGRGYVGRARRQIFLVEIDSGKASQLTFGASDAELPSWSPDGRRIAYVARSGPEPDRSMNFDIFVIDAREGAAPFPVTRSPMADGDPNYDDAPQWSPDGRRIAYLRTDWPSHGPYALSEVAVVDVLPGAERAIPLGDHWHYPPRWSADGAQLYAPVETTHSQRLGRINAETGHTAFLTSERATVYGVAIARTGQVAALMGDVDRPNELFILEDGRQRRLTNHNAWLGGRDTGVTRDIAFRSSDGAEIRGMLMTPRSWNGGPLPTIVAVHGGPVWQWQHEFDAAWHVYAARGFAVLGVNPRGSSGRGQAFSKALWRDWGGIEVDDVLAGVDWAVAEGVADRNRLAVGGWSWGGILTNYLIASDGRFKAAVSGAGMSNFFTAYGTDQYAVYYDVELGAPFENEKLWRRLSYPFFDAKKIRTPTLFLCAEADFNVPCSGAEQMYAALKRTGVPTRLVVFPGENHSLETPSYLEERLRQNLGWFEKWLRAGSQ